MRVPVDGLHMDRQKPGPGFFSYSAGGVYVGHIRAENGWWRWTVPSWDTDRCRTLAQAQLELWRSHRAKVRPETARPRRGAK